MNRFSRRDFVLVSSGVALGNMLMPGLALPAEKGHPHGLDSSHCDLSKIDRSIAKEPAYQHKPKYCLLVFGPQAETRVWLALDGDVLYADWNANGDLTEKGERVVPDGWCTIPTIQRAFRVALLIETLENGEKAIRHILFGHEKEWAFTNKRLMVTSI